MAIKEYPSNAKGFAESASSRRSRSMLRWYYLASAFYLMAMTEALGIFDRVIYGEWEGKVGDKITQATSILVIVTNLVLFGWGFRKTRRMGAGCALIFAAVGVLLLSTLWSIDPQTTMRRGLLYLFAVVGSIGVAGTLNGDEFMDVLGITCAISAVASILLLAISPGTAFLSMGDPWSGAVSVDFRGIFSHKNILGQAMAIGALASLHGI